MGGYAFYLDAATCSGCKACQVACKDKHGLPLGVLWRRVYEVSGGGWRAEGGAWRNDAFAYNLSISCNHCERPVCVEVCPTRAMHRRADGLVLIDSQKCVGCRYCEWACPYGAPQYLAQNGIMSKCTLCADELDAGNPPACVAACGLRALDFGLEEELAGKYGDAAIAAALAPVAPPLPDPAITRPGLLLTAHAHATRAAAGSARVANLEEVRPGSARALREPALVAFTLLAQLGVGLFWVWLALRWTGAEAAAPILPLLLSGPVLLAGMVASLAHLGRPGRAPYALANVRSSWLSREVLLCLAFLGAWSVVLVLELEQGAPGQLRQALAAATGLLGLALIYAMARVYRLRTVPAWNTVRTFHAFLLTALVLGVLGAILLARSTTGPPRAVLVAAAGFVLAAVAAIILRVRFYARYGRTGV